MCVASAAADSESAFARVAHETAVSLSRGVTDSQGQLADLAMQVADQAVRSAETLTQVTLGVAASATQMGTARTANTDLFNLNNAASLQSRGTGQSFRDDTFDLAARSAVQAMIEIDREEKLDEIQFVLSVVAQAVSFVPVVGTVAGAVVDLLNAGISLARGNYQDARDHALYALPVVGEVYGVGQLGFAYSHSLISHPDGMPPESGLVRIPREPQAMVFFGFDMKETACGNLSLGF